MNDMSDTARRQFIEEVEKELFSRKLDVRNTWEETTNDPAWDIINGTICKHAKAHFKKEEHRSELYIKIEKERRELLADKSKLLGERYDAHSAHNAREVLEIGGRIQKLTDRMKQMRIAHGREVESVLSQEIESACRSNKYAQAWRLSRSLSARFIGPRKRKYMSSDAPGH